MDTLVTGFGPFGHVAENPSGRLAEGCGRPFRVLEVAYEAVDLFLEGLNPEGFDTLLMLGVAVGRTHVTPELYARNWKGETADVRGVSIPGPIEETEPLLLSSTLWNAHLVAELSVHPGVFASMDAGSYLCNYLSYRALRRFPQKRVGFLHVPPIERISLERQAETLSEILTAVEA